MQHMFAFASFSLWLRLLWQNGGIERPYRRRLVFVLLVSFLSSPLRWYERLRYGRRVKQQHIHPQPIFILGYGRSGTTHIHNLLCQDPRFAYVTTFQALAPDFFLIGQGRLKTILTRSLPTTRPMDNVAVALEAPQEEELPIAGASPYSFLHHLSFPKQSLAYYDRFVLLQNLDASTRQIWHERYLHVLKKASFFMPSKPLLLKNPLNMARLPDLLQLFPQAKFIHIYRNPYVVYTSINHMYDKLLPAHQMQTIADKEMRANILYFYQKTMQAYLRDRALIPPKNLVEVQFEELEANPLAEMERIYQTLKIGDFAPARPLLERYLNNLSGYRKNKYPTNETAVNVVNTHWRFAVDEWGYKPITGDNTITG
ncbi:MAG: sulfotransferase [Chloroflexi bacterium]|nr:sulfotransferase [Ardenticatenaceae bacterium]MBL1129709.1 sulfotransferase [Chloroflexota bacterium]NOG35790.1 sulfotransferase [Chloroflexota bacterium]GIK58802.1 MAG: sulfotransferase family protein [Chloroflexota bacterium]